MGLAGSGHPLIVGAGIAGLTIAYRLAEYGLRPLVVEASDFAGNGSTTRNQGWLHAGALHAQSIPDAAAAVKVSRRCQYGHSEFLRFCPEAVEDQSMPSIAVTLDAARKSYIVEQWEKAGVKFKELALAQLEELAPAIVRRHIEGCWLVKDAVINTRVLCSKLVAAIRALGGEVSFRTRVTKVRGDRVRIASPNGTRELSPFFTVLACGYGTNDVLRDHWNTTIPMRYWKSHLLITPKLSDANLFCLDPGETSYLQHGDKTVIGLLHDNIECSHPSHDVDAPQVERMKAATGKLVKLPEAAEKVIPTACIKVDIANDPRLLRNLDVEIIEIAPRLICAFPGKMTEAPFLADIVLRKVLDVTNASAAHPRPLDAAGLFAARKEPRSRSKCLTS